jgi:alpha-D-xyloside xylohydrolase
VPAADAVADPEVMVRASQLAAVSPSTGTPPARMDDRAASLQVALQPYVSELLEEASATGVTAVRPLVFRYPDQGAAADRWDEWMLGDDLLVAPVWEVGDRERTVWFPPGRWVDLWDREHVVEGPIELEVDAPLDTIPLYVTEGSPLLQIDGP